MNTAAFGPAPRPLCGRFFLKSQNQGPRATTLLGSQAAGPSCAGSRVGCAPAPLPWPRIPPEPLLLLTQGHTLSSHSLQGRVELGPGPAAIPPPWYWATVCTLGPRLPRPPCLPSFCPLGPLQAFGLDSLETFVPFFHPLHREQTPTPYAWSQRVLLRVKLVWVPRSGPCPAPSPVLGRLGLHPMPGLQLTFHCQRKREAAARSVSAPGRQRPREAGLGEAGWQPPFINIIHETSCVLDS